MSGRPCRRCGMSIVFVPNHETGNQLPAQRIRTVYQRVGGSLQKLELEGELYVSHFETCPKPGEFSRRKGR